METNSLLAIDCVTYIFGKTPVKLGEYAFVMSPTMRQMLLAHRYATILNVYSTYNVLTVLVC